MRLSKTLVKVPLLATFVGFVVGAANGCDTEPPIERQLCERFDACNFFGAGVGGRRLHGRDDDVHRHACELGSCRLGARREGCAPQPELRQLLQRVSGDQTSATSPRKDRSTKAPAAPRGVDPNRAPAPVALMARAAVRRPASPRQRARTRTGSPAPETTPSRHASTGTSWPSIAMSYVAKTERPRRGVLMTTIEVTTFATAPPTIPGPVAVPANRPIQVTLRRAVAVAPCRRTPGMATPPAEPRNQGRRRT